MKLNLTLNWHFGDQGEYELDPQLFSLLQLIKEQGSLRAAVSQLNMSYRHAWGMLERWKGLLGMPLVIMERGRGARLTELGSLLLSAETHLDAALSITLQQHSQAIRDEIEAVLRSGRISSLRMHASHGLGVALLGEMAAEKGLSLEMQTGGSLECLRSLYNGQSDVAGFHIPAGNLMESVLGHFRSYLRNDQFSLIRLARREQGLIVARGNPQGLESFNDLVKNKSRFVNRQTGSGTRLLFDHLLATAGLRPMQISGYEHVEFTHVAVAAMVATGSVDAGFGIRAAASQFNLDFVPMAHEHYFLAVRRETLNEPLMRSLIELITDTEFRTALASLPGYEPEQSGEVIPAMNLFT